MGEAFLDNLGERRSGEDELLGFGDREGEEEEESEDDDDDDDDELRIGDRDGEMMEVLTGERVDEEGREETDD